MRICVCGLGKIGRPILDVLRMKGFKCVGYDCIPKITEVTLETAVDESDAAIFIVPTPSLQDGSFSNEHLIEALTRFKGSVAMQRKKDYLYIITSTTVPGSCDQFRSIVGENICYKPEFVRCEFAHQDLWKLSVILIGSNSKEAGDRCEAIFSQGCDAPIKRMSLIEAELAKITLNCALTIKISLANQLHLVAKKLGADSKKIMDAVGTDPRIGNAYIVPGWPYAGPCLPRDNRMFRYVADRVGIDAALSVGADRINHAISE